MWLLERALGRAGLGPPLVVPPFLRDRGTPFKVVGAVATVAALLFAVGVGYSILAHAHAALRSILEALPLGDAVAERRREEGMPVLVAALVAVPVVIAVAGLTRRRHLLVRRHLLGSLPLGSLLGISLLRVLLIVTGAALVWVAASIAAGEDLGSGVDEAGLWTDAWQILLALAACAAFAWFGLQLVIESERRRRPSPGSGEEPEVAALAGNPAGWSSAFAAEARRPWVWAPPPVVLVLAVIGDSGLGDAALFALVVLGVLVAVAARRAWRRSRDDHFAAYARARGLEQQAGEGLPPVTPLLRMGNRRWAERVVAGTLPGGIEGRLGFFSYVVADEGEEDPRPQRFTVALGRLDDLSDRLTRLYGEPRSAFRAAVGALGYGSMRRVQLESLRLDARFEIFSGAEDDQVWLRRVFAPSFIVWLGESSPRELGFQLWEGWLCAYVPDHHSDPGELDAICEACSAIGRRLTDESGEGSPQRIAGPAGSDTPAESEVP